MKNIKQIQEQTVLKRLSVPFVLSTLIAILPTTYAQAGYAVSKVVSPTPSLAAPSTASRFAGRDIAYEVRHGQPNTAMPAPVIIQGTPSAAPARSSVVEGFADQVPLSVALQQVLPQGYGYTLGDGVNAGQLVSWRGGRPWQTVVQDMLAPTGFTYTTNERLVMVNNPNKAPAIISGGAQQQPMPMQNAAMVPPQNMGGDVPPPYQPMQPMPQAMPGPGSDMMGGGAPMMMGGGMPMPPQDNGAAAMGGAQPLQIQNPPLFTSQTWEARPGQTLRTLLQDWCARAGTELQWQAEFDYPIMASINMTGTFEEAVRTLLSGFNSAKPVPYGRLHYNPAAGQAVLIVEANGNHYGD